MIAKTTKEIMSEYWIHTEHFDKMLWLPADVVRNIIDALIDFRNGERTNNNIWRLSEDELNDSFIENLNTLKINLGLGDAEDENKDFTLPKANSLPDSSAPKNPIKDKVKP
jgi:hypothetical protein